jgi:hypothetical protein
MRVRESRDEFAQRRVRDLAFPTTEAARWRLVLDAHGPWLCCGITILFAFVRRIIVSSGDFPRQRPWRRHLLQLGSSRRICRY